MKRDIITFVLMELLTYFGDVAAQTYVPPMVWREDEIPNPQKDVWKCGRRGKQSWVCDPNHIVAASDADRMDAIIEAFRSLLGCRCPNVQECPPVAGYGGYQGAVVLLQKLDTGASAPDGDELMARAGSVAQYLRKESWDLGSCGDDILLLVSKDDQVVYTKAGPVVQELLSDECIQDIFTANKHIFSEGEFGKGVVELLKIYRDVLSGEAVCGAGEELTSLAVTGMVFGAVFGVLVLAVLAFCCYKCDCKQDRIRYDWCDALTYACTEKYRAHMSTN